MTYRKEFLVWSELTGRRPCGILKCCILSDNIFLHNPVQQGKNKIQGLIPH
jgi:hypothetical protein